jgi:DeoR/GlpR family transcriptional regulator of sugar metabolism
MRMLAAERHEVLLDRLNRDGKLVARDLASDLGISEDTIRRDLRDLAAAGLCQRVYGGALPVSPAIGNYKARQGINSDGKRRVARTAAALITPGSTVILDGGTTTLAVVAELPPQLHATVVTHSPTIASALIDHAHIEVYLIGGRLFKHSAVACGAAAVEAAQLVNADLFLLGVTGVHAQTGLTTDDSDEAAMKRALASRAADTYVLASSEKIGAASWFTVLPLSKVAGIVTDDAADSPAIREITRLGHIVISA